MLLSNLVNAQFFSRTLEENTNLKKYSSVIEQIHSGRKDYWKFEYVLKNGKVDIFKSFFNDELRSELKLIYDENSNLKYEIITFNINHGKKMDTIPLNATYNQNNLKIEDSNSKYFYNKNNQLLKNVSNSYKTSNGTKGWTIEYNYDNLGNISSSKKTLILDGVENIDVEEFTYDKCKNIKSIKRKSIPEKEYPIIMIGAKSKHKQEFFEYEYNSDCLWTKKFLIVNDKKTLIAEREFI